MKKKYSLFIILLLVCLSVKAEVFPSQMPTVCFQPGTINTMSTNTCVVREHMVPVAEVYSPASISPSNVYHSPRRNGRDDNGNPSDPYMATPVGDAPWTFVLLLVAIYLGVTKWRTKNTCVN